MDVTLQIAGIDYQGWHAVSVQRSIEQAAAQWAASVSEPTSGATALEGWTIRPGQRVVVLVDGEPVITGFVDAIAPRYSATEHGVDLRGRSATGDLVDSAAIVPGGQFKGLTIVEIARRLAEPFGVTVDVSDVPQSALVPIPDVQIQQGETCHAVLERLCRLQSLLVSDGPGGILTIARAGSRRADVTLAQGGNVLSAGAELDESQRFSDYIVKGQRANLDDRSDRADATGGDPDEPERAADDGDGHGGGPAGSSVRATRGSFKDTGVTRYRPYLLTAEMQADDSTCQRRAEWEARRRAGKGLRATFVVGGWRQRGDAGPLWDVNLLVPIVSPWLGLDRELLISSVEFRKDDNGTTTALEVTLPDAFLPEDAKATKTKTAKKKKDASASGADVSDNADLWAPTFEPGD